MNKYDRIGGSIYAMVGQDYFNPMVSILEWWPPCLLLWLMHSGFNHKREVGLRRVSVGCFQSYPSGPTFTNIYMSNSLARAQPNYYPSVIKAVVRHTDTCITWIHTNGLCNHNKTKQIYLRETQRMYGIQCSKSILYSAIISALLRSISSMKNIRTRHIPWAYPWKTTT